MSKIVNINSSMDDGMKEYHKKLRNHRIGVLTRSLVIALVIILSVVGIRFYFNNRSFSEYMVASTVERTDTLNTKYALFGGQILKYSRDGISYTDLENNLLFSITFTMQEPLLVLGDNAGVVADKNGNQIYVFNKSNQTGQITTLLPIKQVAVSDQGIVAILLEDAKKSKLEVYLADGTLLADGEFTLDDAGYPMDLAIAADGTKFSISSAKVEGTRFSSCVGIYNLDDVGENHEDNLVFTKDYVDYMIPEIHYFGASNLAAVGDGILAFYQGTQIPEITKEITFEEEIKSVHYGTDNVGLVFQTEEGNMLKLFDLKGNVIAEIPFHMNYEEIYILDNRVIVYNQTEMGLYSYSGKEAFHQIFETPVINVFPTKSRNKYMFVYANETQLVKLK